MVLIVLIKGHLTEPFLNVLYAHSSPGIAIMSMGQFTLEGIALALLVTVTVELAKGLNVRRDHIPG